MNNLFKTRKDRIAFKILLVFGSLVLFGALVGGKSTGPKWHDYGVSQATRDSCARTAQRLGALGGKEQEEAYRFCVDMQRMENNSISDIQQRARR